MLERTSLRVTTEVIEKNTHELEQRRRAPATSPGVYQWVNKVYQAQMFNYGLRDDVRLHGAGAGGVPDRGARRRARQRGRAREAAGVHAAPDQITESNYDYWVQAVRRDRRRARRRRCTRPSRSTSRPAAATSTTDYNHSGQITIDDGYRAVFGTVGVRRQRSGSDDAVIDVVLGRAHPPDSSGGHWRVDARRSTTSATRSRSRSTPSTCSHVAVAVEVKCQRTDRAMEKWRLETHAKLTTAHKARLAEYEEKLAALELQAGVAIRGTQPRAQPGTHERTS